MFLITTADQRFWKTDGKILFLGEWCKLFSQKASWENLSYEVLPYHWDDRQKLYDDYLYLEQLYEQILNHLAGRLNQIHGFDHSLRYWRIVIGPWLYVFVCIFFDRYQSILKAEECGKVTHTLLGKYDRAQWVLRDNLDFARCFESDEYNQFLFSQIIDRRSTIPVDSLEVKAGLLEIVKRESSRRSPSFTLKEFLRRIACGISQWIPDRLNEIVLVSSSLTTKDAAKLQLSVGQLPYLYGPHVEPPQSVIDFNLRARLELGSSGSEFEKMLFQMIQEQIPSVYLEGYPVMRQKALDVYPKKPRLIFTAIAYETDEAFKFWAAHQIEGGCKLVGTQHGFNYGVTKWFQEEDHQIKIYDQFYTWGWKSDKVANTKPLAAAKFNKVKNVVKPKSDGRILLTTFAWPRYAYKMYSVPISSTGTIAHFNDQIRFARALSDQVRKMLLVRLFPNDRNWSQIERWAQEFPEIECYQGYAIPMFEQMRASRLSVTAPNGTPCLEGFAANFPTVLLWNPYCFELRPNAQPYYDELRRVGILHDTPESAAAKVNEIHRDPMGWWKQLEVQEAKDSFCHQFARLSNDWLDEWKTELLNLCQNHTRH